MPGRQFTVPAPGQGIVGLVAFTVRPRVPIALHLAGTVRRLAGIDPHRRVMSVSTWIIVGIIRWGRPRRLPRRL